MGSYCTAHVSNHSSCLLDVNQAKKKLKMVDEAGKNVHTKSFKESTMPEQKPAPDNKDKTMKRNVHSLMALPNIPFDIWPDVDHIDHMVNVITVAGFSLTAFGVTGTIYFTLRTTREIFQWRTWLRYRRKLTSDFKIDKKKNEGKR